MKYNLLVLFVVLFFAACKSEQKKIEKQNSGDSVIEKTKEPFFSLTIKAQFDKDDIIQCFYTQNEFEPFGIKQLITVPVKANLHMQNIKLDMPVNEYPYNIRLDLGTNKNQGTIKIEACILNYRSNDFVIRGSDLHKFFNFNEGVEMLKDSITFKLKPFMHNDIEKYDPYIVGNDGFVETLITKI